MKKIFLLILSLFLLSTTAEAQFLKKLKKKVERRVEDAVTDNVADKAANEADKSVNKMWTMDFGKSGVPMMGEPVDPELIPETYNFDWIYNMHIKTQGKDMDMLYHLKENQPYVGIEMPQASNMLMVMDSKNNISVMFMESNGNKMMTATQMNTDTSKESEDEFYKDAKLTKIGKKTILGYDCQGYQIENNEYIFKFYVTDETPINFTEVFAAQKKDMPTGFKEEWLKDGKGMMLEMNMTDKKRPENATQMTCTKLEKSPFSISKADYSNMMQK
ncbi:MAG: DUF4412 domain-containing protein [Salegentibacter sp.]